MSDKTIVVWCAIGMVLALAAALFVGIPLWLHWLDVVTEFWGLW